MTRRTFIVGVLMSLALPLAAFAQTTDTTQTQTTTQVDTTGQGTVDYSNTYAFQRNGVFGCSLNGSYSMSVGALSAVGGIFVPVNDAAVTLNTGYLVYKECVLRGIVDRMRENETASLQQSILLAYQRGRNGQPLFSQSLPVEQRATYDKTVINNVQGGYLNTLNPAFGTQVQRAIVQGYMAARNTPNSGFACPYAGNLQSVLQGAPDKGGIAGLQALVNPSCDPLFATINANQQLMGAAAATWNDTLAQLQWGNGNYPVYGTDADGNQIVLTPGSIVGSNALQALQTGFTQLQNANDIDQMIGALFAGITTQVVADNTGLIGLTQKNGTQPSYLDRVVSESAQGLRNSAANAAIQILTAAKQVEQGFLDAMNGIAQKLLDTISNLRAKENTCWNLIIQKVCATPLDNNNKCTAKAGACTTDPVTQQQSCPTGATLKVATTTTASQAVIDAKVAPIATSTQTNIAATNKALGLIAQLIAGVTNTSSIDAQRIALQQLDNLVAQHALHNQYDLQNAQKTKDDISAQMDTLTSDTATAWGDSQDVSIGWCNVNNQAVLDYWTNKWKQ